MSREQLSKSEKALRLIIREGITAKEAAERVGISAAAVSKRKNHPPKTHQNLRRLCEMQDEIETLTKQRDELLAALEKFMDSHEECTDFDGFTAQIVSMDDYHEAQDAIDRAKEAS